MTPNGNIARLPRHLREVLNLRLQDGEPNASVLAWLNARAAVKPLWAGGPSLSFREEDLAQWREQGYPDWLAQQAALAASRRMAEEVAEMTTEGAKPLTERLAAWLAVRYVAQSERLRESTGDAAEDWRRLREFSSDVAALRRGDQNAERLDLERGWLAVEYKWLIQAKEDAHQRWKRKFELAMEAFQKELDGKNPKAKAAFQALAAALRGPFATPEEAPVEPEKATGIGGAAKKADPPAHPAKSD